MWNLNTKLGKLVLQQKQLFDFNKYQTRSLTSNKSFSSYPLNVRDYDLAKFIFTFKLALYKLRGKKVAVFFLKEGQIKVYIGKILQTSA